MMDVANLLRSIFMPWVFLAISASYLPGAIYRLIQTQGLSSVLSWSRVQTAWFSAFWTLAGQQIRDGNGVRITALLQGRISQGIFVKDPQTRPISGVVLEIGPGNGYWVDIFAPFDTAADQKSTQSGKEQTPRLKVYGVEPSTDAHPHLKKRIEAAGLEDIYEILPVGIQSLSSTDKIDEGSVDCIVTILCLCSIPEPEKNIRELYKLLKPGGTWYLYEHVRSKEDIFVRLYQRFIGIFWPAFIGGCQLCRNTEASLRNAGQWTTIDLAQPVEEQWPSVIPHILGSLTK